MQDQNSNTILAVMAELQTELAKHRKAEVDYADLVLSHRDQGNNIEITLKTLESMGIKAENPHPETTKVQAAPISENDMKMTGPEMIMAVLALPIFMGGATAAIIIDTILRDYDPSVHKPNLRPTLSRLVKEGRIAKDGTKYKLLNNKENPDARQRPAT